MTTETNQHYLRLVSEGTGMTTKAYVGDSELIGIAAINIRFVPGQVVIVELEVMPEKIDVIGPMKCYAE